jgi:hypothetical protein
MLRVPLIRAALTVGFRPLPQTAPIKEKFGSPDRTAFFKFVRKALELAIAKGLTAVEKSELPDSEEQGALSRLRHSKKSEYDILEELLQVREEAAASRPAKAENEPSIPVSKTPRPSAPSSPKPPKPSSKRVSLKAGPGPHQSG